MENLNQIEYDILNKIENVIDRNSYEKIKTETFGKKELLPSYLRRLGV